MRLHPARAAGMIRAPWTPGWARDELWRRARAVPSLDLRFADSKSLVDATTGQNLVTFSRASGATFVDSQGVIRNAVTNLLVRSEELNDAGWAKVNSAISENTASAPNGTTTADKLVANTANATHRVRIPSASYIAGSIYTFSVYAKAGEYSQLTVSTGTVFTGEPEADYTLSGAGTSNNYGANAASINAVGDGWYRLTITATAASTTTSADAIRISLMNGGNTIFAGDDTSGLFLWGAQLEQSSTVGEYIPTGATINSAPRFDHNPATGESLGLLVEEQRQNLLLNSGTLSTQNVTVTAVAHTLSFTGTGTITLSGTSTAGPLVGTGTGEANRVSLTFTPTAGTLTLTVSGTVTNAQLEIGAFRTSYIPTAGTAATRSADVASISGSNLTSWFNASFGTVFCGTSALRNATGVVYGFGDTFNNTLYVTPGSSNNVTIRSGGASTASLTAPISTSGVSRSAVAYQLNSFAAASDGGTVSTDTSGAVPVSPVRFKIGSSAWDAGASNIPNGHISRLTYWPQRLGDEVLQRITQ